MKKEIERIIYGFIENTSTPKLISDIATALSAHFAQELKKIADELPKKKDGMNVNPNYRDGWNDYADQAHAIIDKEIGEYEN